MDIYELIFTEDIEGLTMLSLVNKPAVKYEVLKFSDNTTTQKFSIVDEEKRMVLGVALLANTPIVRKANKVVPVDHYITMSKETIENLVINYFEKEATSNVSGDHNIILEDIFIYQSIIIDYEKGIVPPLPFDGIEDGSWIIAFKVNNDEAWEKVKAGEYKGISVEGEFMYTADTDELVLTESFKDIYELLKHI